MVTCSGFLAPIRDANIKSIEGSSIASKMQGIPILSIKNSCEYNIVLYWNPQMPEGKKDNQYAASNTTTQRK